MDKLELSEQIKAIRKAYNSAFDAKNERMVFDLLQFKEDTERAIKSLSEKKIRANIVHDIASYIGCLDDLRKRLCAELEIMKHNDGTIDQLFNIEKMVDSLPDPVEEMNSGSFGIGQAYLDIGR